MEKEKVMMSEREMNDEGNVMKICCWLSSKGELVMERLNVFNFAKGRRRTGN